METYMKYLAFIFSTKVILVQGSSCPSIAGCNCSIFITGGLRYDCEGGLSTIPNFPNNTGHISFSNSMIKTVQAEAFENTALLFQLSFDNNTIETVHAEAFENNVELLGFTLRRSSIVNLPDNLFVNNVNLMFLHFDNNLIGSLPSNIFTNNKELLDIDFSDNQVEILHAEMFTTNIKLQKIDFSDNLIEVIPSDIFTNNGLLQEIRLHNNKIKTIYVELFAINVQLELVEMTFNCTCIEKSVYNIIKAYEILMQDLEYNVTCYGSSGNLLEKDQFDCLDFIMLGNDVMECDVCVLKSTTIPQNLNEGSSITTRPQIITSDSFNSNHGNMTTPTDDISAKSYLAIATVLGVMGAIAPVITMVTKIVRKFKHRADLEHIQTTGIRNGSEENILDSYCKFAEIDINELYFKDRPRAHIINIPPACHETSI